MCISTTPQTHGHSLVYILASVQDSWCLRRAGIIWFVSLVLHLLPIRFTQPKMCVLPQQINLESFAPTGSKIRPPLIQLWLSEAHVCWFLNQIHTCRFSHSCSLLSVGQLFVFEDVVQSLSSMCLCDVFSLILTEACTPSNLGVQLRK